MFRGLRCFALAAAAAVAVLVGPSAALACGGGPSAVNIYVECVPTAGGSAPTSGHHPAAGSTTPGSGSGSSAPLPVSAPTKHVLKHAGKDKPVLTNLVRNPAIANTQHLAAAPEPASDASLGSAFDLGSGPSILLAFLAGTILVLLASGGFRAWRNRHRA